MKSDKLKSAIEAALYMCNDPISVESLAKMFKADSIEVKAVLDEVKAEFEGEHHGVHLLETPTGYHIRVKPHLAPMVRNLTPYQDLGRGLLRVLALIAYKQPITQSEVVKVIGNRAYDYVKRLEERGMIKTVKHSRTKALVATKEFANYFGLENPEDIKKFFKDMVKENPNNVKKEALKVEQEDE
ncbi:MAG: SMC-Scp complex subunit ScpB [Candidatus Aenigmatarchaeota archaeon]